MGERSSELEETEVLEIHLKDQKSSLQTRETDRALTDVTARDQDELEATTDDATDETGEEPSDEAVQIREQIVETRREMSETIDAIQEKLSFSNISEQVQTQVSEQINNVVETAKDALYGKTADVLNSVSRGIKDIGGGDLVKQAQRNPTALALVGAGIGALLVGLVVRGDKKKKKKSASFRYKNDPYKYDSDDYNDDNDVRYTKSSRRELRSGKSTFNRMNEATVPASRSNSDETTDSAYKTVADTASSTYAGVTSAATSAYESVGDAAGKTFEGVSNAAGKTFESVGEIAGKTYEAVGDAAGYTYEKAGDLGGQMKINYDHYIEENPLAVGAVALAIGAAIGFAIPLTNKENEYLGEYRDSVLEKAQATAQDALGSVKQMASDAQKVITDEVKSKTA